MSTAKQTGGAAPVALSPRGLLVRAGVYAALFAVAHLAGWREYTSILCGTPPAAGAVPHLAALCGGAYIVTYTLFVVVAPILILAAGIAFVWNRTSFFPRARTITGGEGDVAS